MQPQRVVAPGDFYEPDPFARTSQAKPPSSEPAPSMWEGMVSTFRSAVSIDEAPIRLREATDSALAGIVADLEQRGVDTRRLQRREARAGFALVYDEDAIWQAVDAARRRDGKAFAGLPATLDEFRDRATASVRKSMGDDAATAERSGWVPWLAGTLGAGMSDPLNVATLPLGVGASRSVADAVLKGAMLNTGIEAMQLPSRAVERAAQGRDLTTQEGLITLGVAGVAGGALGGIGKVAERAIAPRSPIATQARETIGVDRMTDAERGAADALDRTAEIDATNPFGPGAGATAHEARMEAEIRAALDRAAARDRPAAARPVTPAPSRAASPAATLSGDARATFKRNVRRAESGGNDAARASTSSATGRYQFTRSTWLNYHRQVVGGEMSDDARWAQATDGNLQERLMDALTADNARALARIGARETPGNLYLMHFAGQAGARKILQAAPDTPIEQILTAEAITANKFLRGKTARDVIEWTHAKVGGDPDVPVLPRDRYADDEQWAAAQREVDAAEAELRAVDDELAAIARGDEADTVAPIERYTAIERDAEPVGMNWEPAIVERPSFERIIDPYSPPKALPRRANPSDVIEFLADRGGIRNDGGHDLLNTHGLARLTVPPVVRKNGMDLDRAGELLWEAGYFVTRPTEAEVLDLVDVAARGRASGRRRYAMGDQDEMDRRLDALDRNERMDHDVRQELDRQFGDAFSPDEDADLFADILSMAAGGKNPGDALIELLDARQATTLARAAVHAEDNGFDDVFPDGWIPGLDERPGGWPTFTDESLGSRAAAESGDGSAVPGRAAGGGGGDRPVAGSIDGSTPEAVAARIAPFDDPFGPGAARQADSLEHDLRMAVRADGSAKDRDGSYISPDTVAILRDFKSIDDAVTYAGRGIHADQVLLFLDRIEAVRPDLYSRVIERIDDFAFGGTNVRRIPAQRESLRKKLAERETTVVADSSLARSANDVDPAIAARQQQEVDLRAEPASPPPGRPGALTGAQYVETYAAPSTVKEYVAQPPGGLGSAVIGPDGKLHMFRTNGSQMGHADEVGHYDFGYATGPDEAAGFAELTRYRGEIAVTRSANETPQQARALNELVARARREGLNIVDEQPKPVPSNAARTEWDDLLRAYDERHSGAGDNFAPASGGDILPLPPGFTPLFDTADQGSFRLAEDGDARAVPDLLDELDGDEAAIVAARACMAP